MSLCLQHFRLSGNLWAPLGPLRKARPGFTGMP